MIKICGYPGGRYVAVVAGVATGNVGRVFSGRSNAIVAANTIANNIIVIKNGGKPASRAVTIITLIAGGNMIRCFSGRLDAVVAGYAIAGYGCVIHEDAGGPRRGVMAIVARGGCRHVIDCF